MAIRSVPEHEVTPPLPGIHVPAIQRWTASRQESLIINTALSRRLRAGVASILVLGAMLTPTVANATATDGDRGPSPTADAVTLDTATADTTSARAKFSRQRRDVRADNIMKMELYDFQTFAFQAQQGVFRNPIDKTLDFSNDGCSLPSFTDVTKDASMWASFFRLACVRHDFGYRNFGKQYYSKNLGLNSSNEKKHLIDAKFKSDMYAQCEESADNETICRKAASAFHKAVVFGGHTAFHGGECQPGNLCVFRDDQYQGKRWVFDQNHPSMDPFLFSDVITSVKNTSGHVWYLFEDEKYKDRRVCLSPKHYIANLDLVDFDDEIDSVASSTRTSC